jgi:hypothetical protein
MMMDKRRAQNIADARVKYRALDSDWTACYDGAQFKETNTRAADPIPVNKA